MLVLLRLALLLFLLVKELTEVHDADNGWLGSGRNLYQVKALLASHLERFIGLHDADLVAFVVDHAHFAGANALIRADKPLVDAILQDAKTRCIIAGSCARFSEPECG
jgi:hypothetical protein